MTQMEGPVQKIIRAVVHGRVQGVFFRSFVRERAQKLGLTGTVQNLPDGTVEVYAQGDEKKLNEFLKLLEKGSWFSRVDSIDVVWQETTVAREDFTILY